MKQKLLNQAYKENGMKFKTIEQFVDIKDAGFYIIVHKTPLQIKIILSIIV